MREPMTGRRPRWVGVAAYASIIVILLLGLGLVLPAGSQIEPAPRAPTVGDVTGDGAACLGPRVVAVQSGVFLDLHVPGPQGTGERDLGPRLVGGRLDADSGSGTLAGSCAENSELTGSRATLRVVVVDGRRIDGEVEVGGTTREVTVTTSAGRGATSDDADELSGGSLVARILLAVAVVIVVARTLGWLFARIGQPRVIGEITAGIVLGPSLLGLVLPGVTGFLFPASVTDVLTVLAQFGLVFFMFLIGLELDHQAIRGSGHTAVLISHYSIVVPLVLGVASALVVYPLVGSGDFTGFALFMGAAMAITAFPVLARILTDTGLHKTRIGALTITCAAVDDLTAWCVLAIVVAIVNAAGPLEAVSTVAWSVVYLAGMLVLVRPAMARVLANRRGDDHLTAAAMSGLLAGLFLSAWLTELIGIHAIFGAFMFGAILPRGRDIAGQVTRRLEDVTVLVLLPVFFAVVGLSTQIGLVSGAQMWLLAGLILVVAIVGKIGGSLVAGLAAGESWHSSGVIGVLMNARGITEIVILTIGRELGVVSPALFAIMVMMALVTTFMTTPIVTRLYPRHRVERDVAAGEPEPVRSSVPGGRRIMVGVTDPVTAAPLVGAMSWFRTADGRPPTVVLASIIAPPRHEHVHANLGDLSTRAAHAAASLAAVADDLSREDVSSEIVTRVGTDRAQELRSIAVRESVDLVVVGSHDAYLGHRPLKGIAGELLRSAPRDVAVLVNADVAHTVRDGPVAVWYRYEVDDRSAVEIAAEIACGRRTSLRLITPREIEAPLLVGVDVEVTVLAEAQVGLAAAAIEGAALVVVAPTRREDRALAMVREAIIEQRTVPVLVVRGHQSSSSAVDRRTTPAVAAVRNDD